MWEMDISSIRLKFWLWFRLMGSGLGSAWREILRLSSHCFDYA